MQDEKLKDQARVGLQEFAALLGVAPSTLRRRIRIGSVPAPRRDGGALLKWSVGDVKRFLEGK